MLQAFRNRPSSSMLVNRSTPENSFLRLRVLERLAYVEIVRKLFAKCLIASYML